MTEKIICFMPSCKGQVKFSCSCTAPETMMCKDHKSSHLKASNLHKIQSFSVGKEKILKCLNKEKSLMIEMKNSLTKSLKESPQDMLRTKLGQLEASINRIDEIISDFDKGEIYIENKPSAREIIKTEVNENKDYLANLIMKEKTSQIRKYIQKHSSSIINDPNQHSQARSELLEISTFDQYDRYIFSKINSNTIIYLSYTNFANKCEKIQLLLDKLLLKIHNRRYHDLLTIDFNYLYNATETMNGTELYIYDIGSDIITTTILIKIRSYDKPVLERVTNLIKISNSSLLIIGPLKDCYNVLLMDLKTKLTRELISFANQNRLYGRSGRFIFYENCLYQFGDLWSPGCMKYDIVRKRWSSLTFPPLNNKLSLALYKSCILVSDYQSSSLYLYDLIIENYSVIDYFENIPAQKFIFTDNVRVFLWMQNSFIYESEENNLFKWNIIGNSDFGISETPCEITFTNYMGNIYASFAARSQMFWYKFNMAKKEMELIRKEIL
ncbi:unnamed protein product [Blepharisma stoltei]|uniref:Uncharacterized protein n=1 Tax=Blepharisma stoltei TaxID=1481888 RepID=A0AAU9JNC6_9CILI|nr:unnamed protein product [Blepharisma stoltei]